nr:glycosyltransferase family 4 protein [Geodermatophilaceae bacterium]
VGRPLILAVARLHEQKGFDVLLPAAARWAELDPMPLVVVAGEGPLEQSLRTQIAELGAPVRLLGRRSDVADLLGAADLVVLPSRWEGWPLAAQEAIRAGVPLVAAAVGGLPELVGQGGVLVRPGDVDALDAAVRRLLRDPEARQAVTAAAGRRAETLPTEQDTVDQIASVYVELLGRP